jgi:hypothetical protein
MKPNIQTFEDVITHKGEEWRPVLEHARQTVPHQFLSDRNLVRLTKGAATIEQTNLIVKLIYQDCKERPIGSSAIETLFRVVDHSNYSLSAWLQGITIFNDWLEGQGRKTPFLKMLGYLQCCEDSPENKDIDHRFVDLVTDMLKVHGYVG